MYRTKPSSQCEIGIVFHVFQIFRVNYGYTPKPTIENEQRDWINYRNRLHSRVLSELRVPQIAKHHASRVCLCVYYTLEDRATRHVTFVSSSWRTACRHTRGVQTAERDSGVNEKVNIPERERERKSVCVCLFRLTYERVTAIRDTWPFIARRRDAGKRENWFARWNIQDRLEKSKEITSLRE